MRHPSSLFHRIAATCLFVAALCGPLAAATVSKLNDDVLAPLRGRAATRQIVLTNVPLYAHGTATIALEEFQVWAPGGKVIVSDGKTVQYLDPPPMRFFRGMVNGDPESFAYFSIDGTTGAIQGLIATRDGKFSVGASRRRAAGNRDRNIDADANGDFDYFLTASDQGDEVPMTGQTWSCDVEKLPVLPRINKRMIEQTDASGHPIVALDITGTQSYAIALEVETDDELYAAASNSVSSVTNLVTNLTGAVSTIYNRDLHTNVVLQSVHVYSGGPSTDPWVAADAASGLAELGNYYHTNHLALKRSAVVMLSGKTTQSGIAWEGTIGAGDQAASINAINTYAGGYAWCGSIGDLQGAFTSNVPDPNATVNGTPDGMPSGGNNFWPLEEYAHELGHNMAGHHTHCVAISDLERAAAGFTDGSAASSSSDMVDHCDATELSTGCYAGGTNYVAGSQGVFKGTIMSYCHNVFLAGVPQSRFTFGQAIEPSHHELDDYMLSASGPLASNFNIVTAVGTFTMSTITASSSVAANSTGNVASVTTSNGGTVTFSWTITGGTIPGSATGTSVTYTADASGSVVLRATAYKNGTNLSGFIDGGVGITDTKTVTITTGGIQPPANVAATATTTTNVLVTWTASSGAAKYHVFRTANNSTYSQVNSESTTGTFFNDTATAGTAYLYKVRAVDGSSVESSDSNLDLATTVFFTDDPLVATTTLVKAVHLTDLRTAVDAVRQLANGGAANPGSYTDPTITATSTLVKRIHIIDLRSALDPARATLNLTALSYTDPTITAGTTVVKAANFTELRNGVK